MANCDIFYVCSHIGWLHLVTVQNINNVHRLLVTR